MMTEKYFILVVTNVLQAQKLSVQKSFLRASVFLAFEVGNNVLDHFTGSSLKEKIQ